MGLCVVDRIKSKKKKDFKRKLVGPHLCQVENGVSIVDPAAERFRTFQFFFGKLKLIADGWFFLRGGWRCIGLYDVSNTLTHAHSRQRSLFFKKKVPDVFVTEINFCLRKTNEWRIVGFVFRFLNCWAGQHTGLPTWQIDALLDWIELSWPPWRKTKTRYNFASFAEKKRAHF